MKFFIVFYYMPYYITDYPNIILGYGCARGQAQRLARYALCHRQIAHLAIVWWQQMTRWTEVASCQHVLCPQDVAQVIRI